MKAQEKVEKIDKAMKQGLGTAKELCKREGISLPYFYHVRKYGNKKRGYKRNATKRTYKRKTPFMDIPMKEVQGRVFLIACAPSELKEVMENLQ